MEGEERARTRVSDQVISENPASRGTEASADLSFEATAANLVAEVRSLMGGYQLPELNNSGLEEKLASLRASRRVVMFLTPNYFSDAGCCAEVLNATKQSARNADLHAPDWSATHTCCEC